MNLPVGVSRPIPPEVLELFTKVRTAYDRAQRRYQPFINPLLSGKLNEAEYTAKTAPARAVPVLEDALGIFTAVAEASDAEIQRMANNQTIYPDSDPRNPARLLLAQQQASASANAAMMSRPKMNVAEFIAQLAAAGIRLSVTKAGDISAAPGALLSTAAADVLRAHKAEVVGLLQAAAVVI